MARASRFWRIIIWLSVLLVLLFVGMALYIPYSLKRRWAAIEAKMAEAGISSEFLPVKRPPLNAEGNFFNHPDLIDLPLNDADPARQRLLDDRRANLEALESGLEKMSLGEGTALGRRLDFAVMAQSLVQSKVLPAQPAPGAEAQAIRGALEARPMLLTLRQQADESTHAEFIPAVSGRPVPPVLLSMPAPHFSVANKVSRPLVLHGMICVSLGDFSLAVSDLQALGFVAAASRREETILAELVGTMLDTHLMQLAWTLLAEPTLPEPQLRRLQAVLNARDYAHSFTHSAQGDLALGLQVLEQVRTHPQAWISELAGKPAMQGVERIQSNPLLLDFNRCFYAEVYLDHFLLPLSREGPVGALARAPAFQARLRTGKMKLLELDKLFALSMITVTDVLLRMVIHAEAQRRQALTACTLEIYQRQYGKYPATLAHLTEVAPVDLMTERPLGYKLTSDGRYQLWSIGLDGKDDGGHVPVTAKGKAPKFTHADYQGDWTWRYTFTP